MSHKMLAGVHFTGSTGVFRNMWKTVGDNIANYLNYPRIVGETGGKDFILPTQTDAQAVKIAMIGVLLNTKDKSAVLHQEHTSTINVDEIKDDYAAEVGKIKVGDVKDLSNFLGAVIDKKSFDNIKGYIDRAAAELDVHSSQGEHTMTRLDILFNQQLSFVKTLIGKAWLKRYLDQF